MTGENARTLDAGRWLARKAVRGPRLRWLGHPLAYAIGSPVLSVLGAGTMLMAPKILSPGAFGQFALLSSLFQFVGRGDLGLSQMADRDIATRAGGHDPSRAQELLRARWVIAILLFATLAPALSAGAHVAGLLSPLDVILAVGAGCAGMVANGPVTIFRARGRIREFTATALALQLGLTAPRLAGLFLAGVTGCFAVMAAWFAAFAVALVLPAAKGAFQVRVLPIVRDALPMFAFYWAWLLYTMANRWVSAWVSDAHEFGLFAFGANVSLVMVGILGSVVQVRYPSILARVGASPRGGCGFLIEREAAVLGTALTVAGALAIALVPATVAWAFPQYIGAIPSTMILAASSVPLCVGSWFVPVVVALSPSPVRDGARCLAGAFLALGVGMVVGERACGIEGQSWGCVVGGIALLAGLLLTMRRLGLVGGGRAVRMMGLGLVHLAALSILVLWLTPAGANDADGPPPDWTTAFEDRFETLSLWDRNGGTWQPHYPWGARTNPPNKETQYYVDPRRSLDPEPLRRFDPFRAGPGGLVISARPLPPAERDLAHGALYASGLLNSSKSFSFQYGYAEMEAQVPKGRGTWPAFWLLPTKVAWPPEIDVMEVLGHETDGYYATLHTGQGPSQRSAQQRVRSPDLSAGFHVYAVKWTAAEVAWYLDGRRVFATPTPPDMHQPMYLLVNLAIGGTWPGAPDAATRFPAELRVRRVRVLLPPGGKPTARMD